MDVLLQFIPIINIIRESGLIDSPTPPEWYEWMIVAWSNILAAQVLVRGLDKLAALTPWGWDDTVTGNVLGLLGRVAKFILGVAAADRDLLRRLKAIRDKTQAPD